MDRLKGTILVGVLIGVIALTRAVPQHAAAQAAPPKISITAPTAGQRITDADIKVSTTVSNYRVQCVDVGLPDKPGQGHIHAMLDGMDMAVLTNFYCDPSFTISGVGLKPGKHTLAVILASDTHADVGEPSAVEFDYQPAQPKPLPAAAPPAGKPTIKVTAPANNAGIGPTFNLQVQSTNFKASCDLEGKGNVVGFGHYHVFVDLDMEAMMAGGMMSMAGMISMPCQDTIPVDLSAWANGRHTITVELVNNDHTSLEGIEPAMITVNLQGSSGRGQATPPRMPATGTGVAGTDSSAVPRLLIGIAGAVVVFLGIAGVYRARRRA